MSRNRSFNAPSNKSWTFDENKVKMGRSPRPSTVKNRLELAREKPVTDNPKLERLLYYKNLLTQSNASTQEVKTLEDLIESLEDKNATKKGEVEEQGEKYLGGYNMMMSALNLSAESVEPNKDSDIAESELEKYFAKLEISTESLSEGSVSVASRQAYILKKLRYPRHMQRIITSSVLKSESQIDNFDEKKSSEIGSIINKKPSDGDLIDYLHPSYPHNPLPEIDVNFNNSKDKDKDTNNSDFDVFNLPNAKKVTECICRREFRKIRCMSCDKEMNGLTLRRCNYHGKIVFSEDSFFCTQCCADIPQLRKMDDA